MIDSYYSGVPSEELLIDLDGEKSSWRPIFIEFEKESKSLLNISFHERTTLRQYLENMPISRFHYVEHLVDECCGNALVEQVAHGIHKDHTWSFPRQWLAQTLRPKR